MRAAEIIARFDGAPGGQASGDAALDPALAPEGPLTPAAVLIPIVEREPDLTVLFTRRTDHLPDHAGQISFPGGRIDPGDADAEAAALRETEEEIGLAARHIRIVGRLGEWVTGTGFSIVPVVGLVEPPFELTLSPEEVAHAFEVPLDYILDSAHHERHERIRDGRSRHFHAIRYGEHFIWGATAGILMGLCERLGTR